MSGLSPRMRGYLSTLPHRQIGHVRLHAHPYRIGLPGRASDPPGRLPGPSRSRTHQLGVAMILNERTIQQESGWDMQSTVDKVIQAADYAVLKADEVLLVMYETRTWIRSAGLH